MDKELIDQLWIRAMRESIENGEQFTRYRFAQLVFELGVKDGPDYKHGFADGAFAEREACAKVCEEFDTGVLVLVPSTRQQYVLSAAIRARGND